MQKLHDSGKNLVNGGHNVAVALLHLELILVSGCIVQSGDVVEEVGVEPPELGALARRPRLDDGVQVLLEVGGAGPQRRLQLSPRPGVDVLLDAHQVPRVRPHHGLGLLARLLRDGDPKVEVERACDAHRRRQQLGGEERRADRCRRRRKAPSAAAGGGGGWLLRVVVAIARGLGGGFVRRAREACGE